MFSLKKSEYYWWSAIIKFDHFSFQVLYCDVCRESCHPKRGPLATHNLGPPRGSWQSNGVKGSRGLGAEGTPICNDHNGEAVTLYCALCKIAICSLCLRDRHGAHSHDVLPLAAACKAQKVSTLIIVYLHDNLESFPVEEREF